MGQDNLVGIVARLRFVQHNNRGLIQFPARKTDFLFSKTFKPSLWPNRPPTLYWGNDLRRKAAEREDSHSPFLVPSLRKI
jgi:hypothetical protein